MLKSEALAHFDNSPLKLARAIGLTRSAVNQWPKIIPLKRALQLNAATDRAIPVRMGDYGLPDITPRRVSELRA